LQEGLTAALQHVRDVAALSPTARVVLVATHLDSWRQAVAASEQESRRSSFEAFANRHLNGSIYFQAISVPCSPLPVPVLLIARGRLLGWSAGVFPHAPPCHFICTHHKQQVNGIRDAIFHETLQLKDSGKTSVASYWVPRHLRSVLEAILALGHTRVQDGRLPFAHGVELWRTLSSAVADPSLTKEEAACCLRVLQSWNVVGVISGTCLEPVLLTAAAFTPNQVYCLNMVYFCGRVARALRDIPRSHSGTLTLSVLISATKEEFDGSPGALLHALAREHHLICYFSQQWVALPDCLPLERRVPEFACRLPDQMHRLQRVLRFAALPAGVWRSVLGGLLCIAGRAAFFASQEQQVQRKEGRRMTSSCPASPSRASARMPQRATSAGPAFADATSFPAASGSSSDSMDGINPAAAMLIRSLSTPDGIACPESPGATAFGFLGSFGREPSSATDRVLQSVSASRRERSLSPRQVLAIALAAFAKACNAASLTASVAAEDILLHGRLAACRMFPCWVWGRHKSGQGQEGVGMGMG
jgi:hypothetical protein